MEPQYIDVDPVVEIIAAPFSDEIKDQIGHIVVEILYEHVGYDRRISRGDLCMKIRQRWYESQVSFLVLSDRKMRGLIEELRCQDGPGCRICSTSGNGGGYFMVAQRRELLKNLMGDIRQAISILRRCSAQRRNSRKYFAINDFDTLTLTRLF